MNSLMNRYTLTTSHPEVTNRRRSSFVQESIITNYTIFTMLLGLPTNKLYM